MYPDRTGEGCRQVKLFNTYILTQLVKGVDRWSWLKSVSWQSTAILPDSWCTHGERCRQVKLIETCILTVNGTSARDLLGCVWPPCVLWVLCRNGHGWLGLRYFTYIFYSLTRQARVSDPLQTNPVSVGRGRVAVEGSGDCCGRKGARCGLDPQSPQT